jgi:short-subunit dehydrogenase
MKRYLITGASRGIGRAIAVHLANSGVDLFLHGRDKTALAETIHLVERKSDACLVTELCHDFRNANEVEQLVSAIQNKSFDAIINNAGMTIVKPMEQISTTEWQEALSVNLTAPFIIFKGLLPHMHRGASIVNILSIASKNGFPNWSSYCASKFAMEGFSQSLREEVRERGIRVVNVYPSATDTELWHCIPGSWPREKMLSADKVADAILFAINQPPDVLVESIAIGNQAGRL